MKLALSLGTLGASAPSRTPFAWRRVLRSSAPLASSARTFGVFLLGSALFFTALGFAPWTAFRALWAGSFGSGFALSETLVKASPVFFCALATALPARLGLVSVGAEGQLVAGQITGTACVLAFGHGHVAGILPAMLVAGALGGAAYGALAGLLRARLRVNETISTLLLNYLPPLVVVYLVYGPWKDPASLGWPATVTFPDGARFTNFFATRLHAGVLLGAVFILVAHVLFERGRVGRMFALLREGPLLARRAGHSFARAAVGIMAAGGAVAGMAGIVEVAVLEGRLQAGVATGAGYTGFLVAFLGRGSLLAMLPLGVAVAGLGAAGDNLQLTLDLPSSIVHVLEGLLFASAIVARSVGRERSVEGPA